MASFPFFPSLFESPPPPPPLPPSSFLKVPNTVEENNGIQFIPSLSSSADADAAAAIPQLSSPLHRSSLRSKLRDITANCDNGVIHLKLEMCLHCEVLITYNPISRPASEPYTLSPLFSLAALAQVLGLPPSPVPLLVLLVLLPQLH